MNQEDAIEAAKQIGIEPGGEIFLASEVAINNAHNGETGEHTDGWRVMRSDNDEWTAIEECTMHYEEDPYYNDEVLFLDGVLEFHPRILVQLSKQDIEALQKYYAMGQTTPENIFAYRQEVMNADSGLKHRAEQAFSRVVAALGMKQFVYADKTIRVVEIEDNKKPS